MRHLGIYDNATIILLSDHGEEFQEHGSVLHEKLYTTVSRIPLIIRPPGGREALRVPQIVESIDLMPTILEMMGVDLPRTPIDGESLLPLREWCRSDCRRANRRSPAGPCPCLRVGIHV